ncbi:MAG: fatty acid desaturase family protein [Pseudomonadota bacterium]
MRNLPPISSLLNDAQIDRLRARSDLWGGYLVAHAWLVIAAACALFIWIPHPLTYLAAVVIIGSRQLGLVILMHDTAHNALFKTPALNHFCGQWLCAFPMLADMPTYRNYHLKHHNRTQQDDDPDIVLTGHYPITRASLKRKLWRDISGQTGFSQRKSQLLHALGSPDLRAGQRVRFFWDQLGRQTIANLTLLLIFAVVADAYLYLILWLVPLLTWQQLVLRIRNIAEHAAIRDRSDPFGNARTTEVTLLERAFISPYWVNYHLEHHLIYWVSCYRLPLLRHFLIANGFGEKMQTEYGYLAVLKKVTVDDEDSPSSSGGYRAQGTFGTGFEAS